VMVFADSSGLYAHYDGDDQNHARATATWRALLDADARVVTTSYVLIETATLLQRRLGLRWVGLLQTQIRPLLDIIWVDDRLHDLAVAATLEANRRQVSVVDHLSLIIMRQRGIEYALAFDKHFAEAGYGLPPLPDAPPLNGQVIPQ